MTIILGDLELSLDRQSVGGCEAEIGLCSKRKWTPSSRDTNGVGDCLIDSRLFGDRDCRNTRLPSALNVQHWSLDSPHRKDAADQPTIIAHAPRRPPSAQRMLQDE